MLFLKRYRYLRMISAFYLTLILFFLYPLLSYWDYRQDIKEYQDFQKGIYSKRWLRNISERSMWLSPFLLLLVEGNFWNTLGFYFVPLCFYFALVDWLSYLKVMENRLEFFVARLKVVLGRVFLAIVIDQVFNHFSMGYSVLVFSALASIFILVFILNNKKMTEPGSYMMIAYGLGLLVLPFFSNYPFWGMGLNIVYVIVIPLIALKSNSEYGNSIFVSLMYFIPTQIFLMVGYACFILIKG
jgi:hypothetical protein